MSIQALQPVQVSLEVNRMLTILTPANTGIEKLELDPLVPDQTIKTFKELLIRIPDLLIYRPNEDDGQCYPCAKSVNAIADEVAIKEIHPEWVSTPIIVAWPQTLVDGNWVYTDPPCYIVGKPNTSGFGIKPEANWEEKLDSDNISFKVKRKIREYFSSCPPIDYL